MRTFWINPQPAQPDDFLALEYSNAYGYPDGASSQIYRHPWSDHDHMGLAAEVEIVRELDSGYRVQLIQYSWDTWSIGTSHTRFERFNGCSVQLWDSHETFGQFFNAEAYALFCWSRWRATGAPGAAGMRCRDDLDSNLNPVPEMVPA